MNKNEAIKQLKLARTKGGFGIRPKQTIYTCLRHVSSSGMTRAISLHIVRGKEIVDISWAAARALEMKIDQNHGGIRIGGCGMDMGFALVYDLGRVLWPNGTRRPHSERNGQPDRDGGYALTHRWL